MNIPQQNDVNAGASAVVKANFKIDLPKHIIAIYDSKSKIVLNIVITAISENDRSPTAG